MSTTTPKINLRKLLKKYLTNVSLYAIICLARQVNTKCQQHHLKLLGVDEPMQKVVSDIRYCLLYLMDVKWVYMTTLNII